MEFPAGAVSDDTDITIRMLDEQLFVFELMPHGIQFGASVTMKIHLDQTNATVVGNSIVWYDENGVVWKILPTTPVDATTVKTDLMHFSKYGDVNG